MKSYARAVPAALFALACLCGRGAAADSAADIAKGLQAIKADDVHKVIETLSSDEFEGREPGSHGETLTVDYIADQFKKIGLAPGNPNGTYIQNVPLTGNLSHPQASVGGQAMNSPDDFVAWSYERQKEVVVKESDLVFVGYGVVAPEYGWDDFKGADLKGKTLVMLINDPPIPDPSDPSKLDEKMFKGKAMTYYGRWTYKYEIARKMGAAGALIIHETEPAAYPYSVVVNSNSHENFQIHAEGPNEHFPTVSGWLSEGKARGLLKSAGYDLDDLKKKALSKDFRPVDLKTSVSFDIKKDMRDVDSRNVVAKIEGSDPKLKDEVLVFSAHWDHLGWDPALPGTKHDQVYHGALDNASGISGLIELAKAFKALPKAPKRTILFLATTAEEKGLLGAQYYAAHPLYPLKKTVADINIDGLNILGKTHDIEIIGSGNTTLEDDLAQAAATTGRVTKPDARPEHGGFYRADQLEFARVGVPVLFTENGDEGIDDPAGLKAKIDEYTAKRYHNPLDQITPDWNFDAAVDDLGLLFRVGYDVAQGQLTPQWKDGSEFKAIRDKMMSGK